MVIYILIAAFYSSLFFCATASPLIEYRSGVTTLTAAQISSYHPYTLFARAVYCSPSETATWSCGPDCSAISGFVPYATGGDGGDEQYWYVGYNPVTLKSAVVAHQGTDVTKIMADLTNLNYFPEKLDPTLFPGVPSSLEAHNGFLASHARSAPSILAAVQKVISATGTTKVAIVGHSLGGALAELDAVYLPLHPPSSIKFTTVTYGCPRVGNPAFASYVDSHATFVHINKYPHPSPAIPTNSLIILTSKKDPVPTLPEQLMGFEQPAGEKHITEAGTWVACSGDDNHDPQCEDGTVPNIAASYPPDHLGPYNGIYLGLCDS